MLVTLLFIFAASVSGNLMNSKGQCRLDPHPSVEYHCILPAFDGTRVCSDYEPAGTIVSPQCRKPNYYSWVPLAFMKCINGYWDYSARCTPECGRVTPDGQGLVLGGRSVKRGELPWHAGIYTKASKPYMQICGGSLISNNVLISAAHCFWSDLEQQQPASQFAVAVGKLYRPWNDKNDQAQKSNVKVIHLPPRYQGAGASFQDDIAVVIVARTFQFRTYIRPVCLSFEYHFEKQQLYSGNKGKVAGWGLTAANSKASPVLQVVDLPYVDVRTCIIRSPADFREYITSDKICAGTLQSNTALCKGDSGGGLAFPEWIHGIERYYLRGVVSTAATSENACNTDTYTSFTSISAHEHFIKQFWSESGQFRCQDGSFITAANYCDGTKECPDGSDETARACAANICSSYLFQCAYGACVDRGATCNGVMECVDGSDEAEELCNKLETTPVSVIVPNMINETLDSAMNSRDEFDDFNYILKPNKPSSVQLECGRLAPELTNGKVRTGKGQVPWHVGIYMKTFTPYKQWCAGSLISNDLFISAAQCYWSVYQNRQLPTSQFAVAVGKLYRSWDDDGDGVQKSHVKEIHLNSHYVPGNYQNDIALVVLADAFEYSVYIRPVCLSFDFNFDKQQLHPGSKGMVAIWGLGAEKSPTVLQVKELPYVQLSTCINEATTYFRQYITNDKICAGFQNSDTVYICKTDGGAGLAFPAQENDALQYYLRGVASTAPYSVNYCNSGYVSFTHILRHEYFIKQFWKEK